MRMSSGLYRAVGLMSGTSMDGIDAALIETDGEAHVRPLGFHSVPYAEQTREKLRASIERALAMEAPGEDPVISAAAAEITALHADAVRSLLEDASADIVGFHGQTIAHRPERGWTWQIGDGSGLARALEFFRAAHAFGQRLTLAQLLDFVFPAHRLLIFRDTKTRS